MMITLRGMEIMQVRRGCDAYGVTIHLAIGMQQGWLGTYLGLRVKGLAVCTSLILPDCLA